MKLTKKMIPAAVAASIFAGAMGTTSMAQAEGELAGSVAISNMYLWRGLDLGNGDGVVSGDLSYSMSGFHTGVWASSGDSAAGQEYDLWVGYGGEMGDFTYDISAWTYVYPSGPEAVLPTDPDFTFDDPGNLSEVILTVGYGDFSVSYYDNVAGGAGYTYLTLSGGFDKFSATLGMHSFDDSTQDMTHLDLSYAVTDNLSLTVSSVVDEDTDGTYDNDSLVQVSYSLPL